MYVGRFISCALLFLMVITTNKLLAVTCEDVFAGKSDGISIGADLEKTRNMLDSNVKRTFVKVTMRKLMKDVGQEFTVLQAMYGEKHSGIFDQFRDRIDSFTEENNALLAGSKKMKSSLLEALAEFNSPFDSNKSYRKFIDMFLKDVLDSEFGKELYSEKKEGISSNQTRIVQRLNELENKITITHFSTMFALHVTASYHNLARGYGIDLKSLSSLREKFEIEMLNRASELLQQRREREQKRRVEKSKKEHDERIKEILNSVVDKTGIEI